MYKEIVRSQVMHKRGVRKEFVRPIDLCAPSVLRRVYSRCAQFLSFPSAEEKKPVSEGARRVHEESTVTRAD